MSDCPERNDWLDNFTGFSPNPLYVKALEAQLAEAQRVQSLLAADMDIILEWYGVDSINSLLAQRRADNSPQRGDDNEG